MYYSSIVYAVILYKTCITNYVSSNVSSSSVMSMLILNMKLFNELNTNILISFSVQTFLELLKYYTEGEGNSELLNRVITINIGKSSVESFLHLQILPPSSLF